MAKGQNSSDMRRVQLTGGATFIVSLPKDWVNEVGLRQGDLLSVSPQPDGSLSILPQKKSSLSADESNGSSFELMPGDDPDDGVREFIARYLAGHKLIKIFFRQQAARYKHHIKEIIRRKLIGVEIVEEFGDGLTAQCLLYSTELPVKKALARMSIITSAMQKDVVSALKGVDRGFASEIIMRDDEIDRFYFYIVRQLKMAVNNRSLLQEMELKRPTDCLGYRLVVKSVERVADHAVRIAESIRGLSEPLAPQIYEKIARLSKMSNDIYEKSMESLENLDAKMAKDTISRVPEAAKFESEIMKEVLNSHKSAKAVMDIEVITHALKRIAEYGSDIAEMAINLCVENAVQKK